VTARRSWFAPAALLLAPALVLSGADKDTSGDPLPEGAKARIGTARSRVESAFCPPLLTPDGRSVYAQTNFGVRRFDPVAGGPLERVALGYGNKFAGCSADGTRIAQCNVGEAVVWNVKGAKALVKVQRRLPDAETAVALSADGKTLVLGGTNEGGKQDPIAVLVWDVDGDKERQKIVVPHNQSVTVAVSGDAKVIASWGTHLEPDAKGFPDPEKSLNRVVRFWGAGGTELGTFRTSGYSPAAVVLSPDGSVAAVANGNGTIDLVDPKTGASKQLLLGRTRMGGWLAFSPDGATVAATGEDGAVRRWRVADGATLSTTEAPVANVTNTRVRLQTNEKGLAWGTKGLEVVVWEVPSGKALGTGGGHTRPVRGVAVTADNTFVVTSADDGTIRKWELATGKPVGELALRRSDRAGDYGSAALCSSDLSRALVRDYGNLILYDLTTGTQQYVVPTPLVGYSNGTFSGDGSKVIVATSNYDPKTVPARASVWAARAGKRLFAVEQPGVGSFSAAVTPDGKYVVAVGRKPAEKGNGEFVATVWEVATGLKKGELIETADFTNPQVVTAPDNKTAALVTAKGQLVAFDLASAKITKTYKLNRQTLDHNFSAIAPVFSPDGKKLAVVGRDAIDPSAPTPVLVLDWATGETKATFGARGGSPTAMAFSPDGKWLVTGAPDTTATVWDVSK
jgi:WD40 repeat protein